jgi:hypothetical protein
VNGIVDHVVHFGAIIATATLVDCVPAIRLADSVSQTELDWGYWLPAHYALVFEDMARLPIPIPAKGRLGLWTWKGYTCPLCYDTGIHRVRERAVREGFTELKLPCACQVKES